MTTHCAIAWLALLFLAACRTADRPARAGEQRLGAASAVDLVQLQLDAYNAQDLEAFAATYSDDVVVTSASTGQELVRGKDALRKRYATLFERFPNNRCRVSERRTEGDGVVLDHEIIAGRGPEKPDPWDAGWVRYEIDGGLIRRVQLP